MTRDEFQSQSNELFFKIKKSLVDNIMESVKPAFEEAQKNPNQTEALFKLNMDLNVLVSTKAFEASCDYSEKLALLLFDQLSK